LRAMFTCNISLKRNFSAAMSTLTHRLLEDVNICKASPERPILVCNTTLCNKLLTSWSSSRSKQRPRGNFARQYSSCERRQGAETAGIHHEATDSGRLVVDEVTPMERIGVVDDAQQATSCTSCCEGVLDSSADRFRPLSEIDGMQREASAPWLRQ
jgi:hypothetical protein